VQVQGRTVESRGKRTENRGKRSKEQRAENRVQRVEAGSPMLSVAIWAFAVFMCVLVAAVAFRSFTYFWDKVALLAEAWLI
jgi:magnesium-transporting ATPase (P-type)